MTPTLAAALDDWSALCRWGRDVGRRQQQLAALAPGRDSVGLGLPAEPRPDVRPARKRTRPRR